MKPHDDQSTPRDVFMRDATVTAIMAALTLAALDDITTDNDLSFVTERILLMVATGWFIAVALRIRQYGYRSLGLVSIVVAAGTGVAQLTVGQGETPVLIVSYITALFGLIWLTGLAALLAWAAWRAKPAA
jgi:hypothetical protein